VALAPAATEARREPGRWIGFEQSEVGDLRRQPICPLRIFWGENVIYGDPEGTTAVRSTWIPHATYLIELLRNQLEHSYSDPDIYWVGNDITCLNVKEPGLVMVAEAKQAGATLTVVEDEPGHEVVELELPESASVAREVRDLSGLSAGKLGDLFPVERESFQRWMSGKLTPSSANLERLLALRHFLRALADRVDDRKSWLLSPLTEGAASPTAYEVLKTGNLRTLWDAIVDLPSTARRRPREITGEGTVTVVDGSLRGRDHRTSEEELDDYDELFDGD
jgi:hypothetical protein